MKNAMITNAVRCVPPQNKPTGAEINTCRPFLDARIRDLPRLKTLLMLGKIAHDSTLRTLGLKLKDLQTRLAWGLVYQVPPLSDDTLRDAFRQEIEARSLEASDEVLGYVLRRFPRRIATLKHVVDALDEVSLSEQRRITIPLVKSVFGDAEQVALSERTRR